MHRTIFFLLAAFFLAIVPASSQDIAAVSDSLTTDSVQAELPFRVTLYSPDAHITLALDLYEESVTYLATSSLGLPLAICEAMRDSGCTAFGSC